VARVQVVVGGDQVIQHFCSARQYLLNWMTPELSTLKCQYVSWYAVKIQEN
jgi:hypothetical protein